ncbi:sterol desaturase family protein [Pseudomonas aeruginosa]|uniref:sterol desaturase family protein n=1 Tax=Pseudomonas aeruginosa TaxID=287 RepID=UPI003F346D86
MERLIAFVFQEMDWTQRVLVACLPLFAFGLLLEWLCVRMQYGNWQVGAAGNQFEPRELLANLLLGQGYYVFHFLMHWAFVGAVVHWAWQHRLFTIPINAWTVLPIFLVEELCYYVYHRCAHRVRWFWTLHVSHHSGEIMNMSTAARQSILNGVVGFWIFFLPPVLLGIDPAFIALLLGLNLAFQWFIHTETVPRLHWTLEWLLNTPSNHRVHHGRNPQYLDKNFGGVLMLFDHLFGSYAAEHEKVEYGTPLQIRSYNWLVLNLHEFVDLWRDVLAPGPLAERLKHFWMPPEWQREGHRPLHTWTVERQGSAMPEGRDTSDSEDGSRPRHLKRVLLEADGQIASRRHHLHHPAQDCCVNHQDERQ